MFVNIADVVMHYVVWKLIGVEFEAIKAVIEFVATGFLQSVTEKFGPIVRPG